MQANIIFMIYIYSPKIELGCYTIFDDIGEKTFYESFQYEN
jgi:hypothetical protein